MTAIQLLIGALTLVTYLHMLIGEMVPKNIALAAPAPTALLLGPPLVALAGALRPLVFGINAFASTLLRLMKVEPKDEVSSVFTDDELARLIKDSRDAGLIGPADGERLQDALELGTRTVGEIMIPRERFVGVTEGITPRELERTAAEHGFSRLVVTGAGGGILGFLHIKDALAATDRTAPFPHDALHTVTEVTRDTPLDDTMTAVRTAGTHLAAVTGTDGEVVGFVTTEDVLEELVAEAAAPGV